MSGLPYRATHRVIPGRKHGRQLGFPTLNFDTTSAQPPFEPGVYAGFVTIQGKPAQASFYYGPRHALGDGELSFEAYLLDTTPDTVPHAKVHVALYLRPVKEFGTEAELKQQIEADVAQTREALKVDVL